LTKSAKIVLKDLINDTDDPKVMWLDKLFSERFRLGKYLKLQDLTKHMDFPCVLDIKMGFKPLNEKDADKYKTTTSTGLGFRICGMNVYLPKKK